MPVWVIELFAARNLDVAYSFVAMMTAPIWLAMVIRPHAAWVRLLAQPLIVTTFYSLVYGFILWRAYDAAVFPSPFINGRWTPMRQLLQHPIMHLALFCNYQILSLVLGTLLLEKANRLQQRISIELVLIALFGVFGVFFYYVRAFFRKGLLSWRFHL